MDTINKQILTCTDCGQKKQIDFFYKTNKSICKTCLAKKHKQYEIDNRERTRLEWLKKDEIKCSSCKTVKPIKNFNKYGHRCKKCIKKYTTAKYRRDKKILQEKYIANIERKLLIAIKTRCKKLGIPFNLEESDIIIPEYCPVLGIKLEICAKQSKGSSPSVDRLIPKLGYTKGNIRVISRRANTIKNDATIDEHLKIVDYMRENIVDNIEYMI